MKNCLICQPIGLGDILFVQGIIKHLIDDGWTVHYPVNDFYYESVSSYIKLDGLIWYRESDSYPLKEYYGREQEYKGKNEWYLPLNWADCYSRTRPMIAKYFYAGVPVDDWRKGLNIKRNYSREQKLIEKYNLNNDYVLINRFYNWPVLNKQIEFNRTFDIKTHFMNGNTDSINGFNIFDWIGAIENAKEIHTVGTSIAYLVDKYAKTDRLYLYERKLNGQDRTYHEEIHLVHRNPNWIYQ